MSQHGTEVLVTGGAGYIGSHVCVALIEAGFTPVIVDNFCNSKPLVVDRIAEVAGERPAVYEQDVNDRAALASVLSKHDIQAVMHFAGLKAVGESTEIPLTYYRDNVAGALTLCEAMADAGVWHLIFSSSATVYGDPASVPINEEFPRSATNPYGRSKLMIEQILEDAAAAPDSRWNVSLLRYFNPVGAHASGRLGEDPSGIPNNLVPYVAQVAVGKRPFLQVFGDDYPTPDGTGVRDYIHVVDLAAGHVAALTKSLPLEPGCRAYNLGTGIGYSVLDVVRAFEQACGKSLPYQVMPRRPGDIAKCFADPAHARQALDWRAERDLAQMMQDSWRWQSQNPDGYV
ncbi:UDP-glucose 4-epimerase GalE [Gilvimarinus agarilyticus]|uniref:UDP-glucose 4-epimerase GalE n=1 Tax=Gilvimarinus agarilyticus TaxID=679259 RepID=UPI0005A0761B|nr:UDP-glucose 4-epimerase GalE [Gilvimarinus agarilyticus]